MATLAARAPSTVATPASSPTPTTATWTELTVTGTALPSLSCSIGTWAGPWEFPPKETPSAVGIAPINNQTYQYMKQCCDGGDIVVYQHGCSGMCVADDKTPSELSACYNNDTAFATPYKDGIEAVMCSACSLTGSATMTSTSSATVSPTKKPSSAAVPASRPGGGEGVAKICLAIASILAFGFLTGAVL